MSEDTDLDDLTGEDYDDLGDDWDECDGLA